MTTEHQASRTLVKSPPELWTECSDAGSLTRHLGEFGEIRITRLEPETTVAWEGEHASGTVQIEPAGWGTKVTLTAQATAEALAREVTPAEPADVQLDTSPAPPTPEGESLEEEADAKLEEALEKQDPDLAADSAPARGRWKRLVGRTRGLFKPRGEMLDVADASHEDVAAVSPGEAAPEQSFGAEYRIAVSEAKASPEPGPAGAQAAGEADVCESQAERDPALDPGAVLTAALESLGQAHHRPFSRA